LKYKGLNFYYTEEGMPRVSINGDDLPGFLVNAHNAIESKHVNEAIGFVNEDNVKLIDQIVDEDPSRVDVMMVFAKTLFQLAKFTSNSDLYRKSEHWYKKMLDHCPNSLIYNQLGNICKNTGRISESLLYRKKALDCEPNNIQYKATLGVDIILSGNTEEGLVLLREASEKTNARIHSGLLINLHYLPKLETKLLFDEHKKWGQIHVHTNNLRTLHKNTIEPDRKLLIGYISPDFRLHSVIYFLEPILNRGDSHVVENYGYGSIECPDKVTEWAESKFDHYRNIFEVSDEVVASLIEKDKIDILVDLAGHTAGNRLPVLAYKPAPIQFTYLGYPNTTGMETVDYRFTDELVDPPPAEEFYTEQLVYLPEGFHCYGPPAFAPPVAPPPVLTNGFVTFGSFNNNIKINSTIMEIWADVLKSTPNSRLLLKFKAGNDKKIRERYLNRFGQFGVNRDKIEIYGPREPIEHLEMYSKVDISLDTYPYNGTTTTCEAMWMGVPVVSLVGEHHASRVGLSLLTRVGLEFFAAATPDEYVAKVTALAQKPKALAKIRSTMRGRMLASSLCNTKKFAGYLESAYRKVWQQWCHCQNVSVSDEQVE